jgi:sortase A
MSEEPHLSYRRPSSKADAAALSRPEKRFSSAVAALARPTGVNALSLARPEAVLAGGFGGGASIPLRSPFPVVPRRFMRVMSWLLVIVGLLTLVDAGVTLVWQEPFSALYASFEQNRLSRSLSLIERAPPQPAIARQLSRIRQERQRIAVLADAFEHQAKNGSAVGRIEIPRIGANFVVVKGTDTADLEKGPGVYSETNFPGIAGTTAIAGHRTTYLAPFRHIDQLRKGDQIIVRMPYGRFTYTVTGERSVLPSDVRAAIDYVGYTRLVLSACTPPFSAAERLLVFARFTRVVPLGAARRR